MPRPQSAEISRTARRTRRAIIVAAIDTLAANPQATLAEIAEAGDLSRSTLHRHFADRADLLAALNQECQDRFAAAADAARLGEGGALASLDRLAQEYLELGPVLGLIFADNAPVDPDSWEDSADDSLAALIRRSQGGRSPDLDPELAPEWVITTFWVLLFGAWLSLKNGMPRRRVADQLSRTLRNAFAARRA